MIYFGKHTRSRDSAANGATKNYSHGSLNAIDGSWKHIGHPVAQGSSVAPLEEDSKACP